MSTEPRTIRLRAWPWDPDSVIEVILHPGRTEDEWEVEYAGQRHGRVGRYEGSLDRPTYGGRLRIPGKRRTLWSSKRPDEDRPWHGRTSRAEAIRHLLRGVLR